MAEIGFRDASKLILDEIGAGLAEVKEEEAAAFGQAVLKASAVFVTGEGRSGLVGRCFAMRLMHLGMQAHVVGDSTTPAMKKGDLLIALTGSGESEVTRTRARAAASCGARVAAVTAADASALAREANPVVVIPAAGGSAQYGGSRFEQSLLIFLDAVALQLQRRLGRTEEEMDARHANVE